MDTTEIKQMVRARCGAVAVAPLPSKPATDRALLCGCMAGGAPAGDVEHRRAAEGFTA